MSIGQEQKIEAACNPCGSVVTIPINRETICDDSDKPKVDNKTISYNENGELQFGYDGNLDIEWVGEEQTIKYKNKYISEGDLSKLTNITSNHLNSDMSFSRLLNLFGYANNFYLKNDIMEIYESSDLSMTFSNVKSWSQEDAKMWSEKHTGLFQEKEVFSTSSNGRSLNYETNKQLGDNFTDILTSSIIDDSDKDNYIIIKKYIVDNIGNNSLETDFDFDLRAKKVRVNDKNVVCSINGILANDAGELPLEINVLTSADGTKFKLMVSNEGFLGVQKIQ